MKENQDCSEEAENCHEVNYSAAPVAENEKSPSQIELNESVFLGRENQDCGEGVKPDREDKSSVALMLNSEKWSCKSIVVRQMCGGNLCKNSK